ncbi:MAG: flagellar hook-length control protein FliK [Lachnospiraceae bacterium]|nr:flagellar hook-length control protein FliK [Lachnospiraceae bacterium]
MQISDLMGQYHPNTSKGAGRLTGTKGVENLVSEFRSLTKGNIFEGTISAIKNKTVVLALSNGQQISARLEGKVDLSVGESMFFQVKSNDGSQIEIRPFVEGGTGVNYTLLQALAAAGLPKEPEYLSMVNRMMQEQMPIDKGSLQQMARTMSMNSDIDVQTLVQLKKLGIPITPENASMFENYMDDKQAITRGLEQFMTELPELMGSDTVPPEEVRHSAGQILSIITEGIPEETQATESRLMQPNAEAAEMVAQEMPEQGMPAAEKAAVEAQPETGQAAAVEQEAEQAATVQQENGQAAVTEQETGQPGVTLGEQETAQEVTQQITQEMSQVQEESLLPKAIPHTLGAILEPEQLENLNQMIGKLIGIEKIGYTAESQVADVLKDLQQVLKDPLPLERTHLAKILSSPEFKGMVRDAMEQQWLIPPSELAGEENKIGRLYERLNGQLEQIGRVLKGTGQGQSSLAQLTADLQNNIEFMNQINQTYTYVQLPLKMSGQNASGQLYVYTNKKALEEGEKDLTAFLHLDMDNLGPTDISVRLRGKEVSTNFYLENEEAYMLLERNLPVLEARLQKKGYHCNMSVINEEKHVNFVEDFLKKDQPNAGQLHRYSFDVRA